MDWYEDRLRGGSRGEAYELVFASVPQEVWEQGPSVANAWIKAHLPKAPEAARPAELPEPITGVDAPFTYGWTASERVAVVAGSQICRSICTFLAKSVIGAPLRLAVSAAGGC